MVGSNAFPFSVLSSGICWSSSSKMNGSILMLLSSGTFRASASSNVMFSMNFGLITYDPEMRQFVWNHRRHPIAGQKWAGAIGRSGTFGFFIFFERWRYAACASRNFFSQGGQFLGWGETSHQMVNDLEPERLAHHVMFLSMSRIDLQIHLHPFEGLSRLPTAITGAQRTCRMGPPPVGVPRQERDRTPCQVREPLQELS